MLVDLLPAFGAQSACTIASAVCAGRRRTRAVLSGLFALGALLSPLLLPADQRLLRFVLAVSGMAVAFRALDLARDPRDHPLWMRLWIFVAVLDVRRLQPRARRLDWPSWGQALGYAALATAGYFVAFELAPRVGGVWTWGVRWLGGAVLIYGIADVANHGAAALFALGRHRIPPQHDAPIRALSVGDFWSKHYNLNVSDWLARNFYQPLARKDRRLAGLFLAFLVSGGFHLWICWVCLDLPMALLMGAFFVVQGVVIAIERVTGQKGWPRGLRHPWTLGWMLAACPLFVEPFLRIVS